MNMKVIPVAKIPKTHVSRAQQFLLDLVAKKEIGVITGIKDGEEHAFYRNRHILGLDYMVHMNARLKTLVIIPKGCKRIKMSNLYRDSHK